MIGTALRRTAQSTVTPPPISTWLAAYWAADPAWTNPGDGNVVASWRDWSGNTRNVSQGSASLKPIYRASHASFNSQAVVDFDADDALTSAAFTYASQVTLLAISRTSSTASNRFVVGDSASVANVLEQNRGAVTKPSLYGGGFLDSSASMNTSARFIYAYINGASSYIVCDATKTSGSNGGSSQWGTSKALMLGSNLLGQIAFVGLYAGDIETHGNWSAFKTWANTTYGVTT